MKRWLILLAAMLPLTGCAARVKGENAPQPIAIDRNASPLLRAEDGYCYLPDTFAEDTVCQMLLPKALAWYQSADSTVRFCDVSGENRVTFEYRGGDDFERCYTSYLHDLGCRLPANRIQTYELQSVGAGSYSAYRIDAREQEAGQPERMMTYWFIDKPHAPDRRSSCYIITMDTVAENVDTLMCSIQTFAVPDDYDLLGKETPL